MCADGIGPLTGMKILKRMTRFSQLRKALGTGGLRDLCSDRQLHALQAEKTGERQKRVLQRLKSGELTFHSYFDQNYPDILRQISDPPLGLFVRGTLKEEDEWALAVVGTRKRDVYGRESAETFCRDCAALGITVVSGLARGIDTDAHRSVLKAGGRTLAVMGTPVDLIYPAENRDLAQDIIRQGALISEVPPRISSRAVNFVMRNRIIAGLSRAVLVVQAGEKSGALTTAYNAAEQNRDVFAVPGQIDHVRHRGCHSLIKQGAKLVETIEDILIELPMLQQKGVQQLTLGRNSLDTMELDESEMIVMEQLQDSARHVDDIQHSCGLAMSKILSSLLNLELKGFVKQYPGQLYKRTV